MSGSGPGPRPYLAGTYAALESALTCLTHAIDSGEVPAYLGPLAESLRLTLIRDLGTVARIQEDT